MKKFLEFCEEYLPEHHNLLHSADRIRGIKKIKNICIKSLKSIHAESIKGWEVPGTVVDSLKKEW